MPRFLSTKGQPTLGIGLCSRCQTKRVLAELVDDGNIKGFKVCDPQKYPGRGCWDNYDPWRLPAPLPDRIQLPFVRPDSDITIYPNGVGPIVPPIQEVPDAGLYRFAVTQDGQSYITSEGGIPLFIDR